MGLKFLVTDRKKANLNENFSILRNQPSIDGCDVIRQDKRTKDLKNTSKQCSFKIKIFDILNVFSKYTTLDHLNKCSHIKLGLLEIKIKEYIIRLMDHSCSSYLSHAKHV